MRAPEQLELEKENQQLGAVIAELEGQLRMQETEVQGSKYSKLSCAKASCCTNKYSTTSPYVGS